MGFSQYFLSSQLNIVHHIQPYISGKMTYSAFRHYIMGLRSRGRDVNTLHSSFIYCLALFRDYCVDILVISPCVLLRLSLFTVYLHASFERYRSPTTNMNTLEDTLKNVLSQHSSVYLPLCSTEKTQTGLEQEEDE